MSASTAERRGLHRAGAWRVGCTRETCMELCRGSRARIAARMTTGVVALGVVATLGGGRARAATIDGSTLTLTLAPVDGSSAGQALDTAALGNYFSAARCACPGNLQVTLALSDAGAQALGSDTLQATLGLGSACDDTTSSSCVTVGSILTLDAQNTSASTSLSTADVFQAAAAGASCAALKTTSTRLWAIVLDGGARLSGGPSLALGVGGAGPQAPAAVTAQSADSGLLVSWKAVDDASKLMGYQVLCSPGPSPAQPPAYDDSCAAALPGGGSGPFATLDASLLCSGLVSSGTSARVHGLENGRSYQVAVIAIGVDGTPSVASATADGAPAPTLGFDDVYGRDGGTLNSGCEAAGAGGGGGGVGVIVLAMAMALAMVGRRRASGVGDRRRVSVAVCVCVSVCVLLGEGRAMADFGGIDLSAEPLQVPASPRRWNVELRFGPYRPEIDSQFADRGLPGRPFAETFGSSRHLMTGLEIDRHLLHRGGTWALGLGAGYYNVSAAALGADGVTRSGDETSLRLFPLSASLVFRADTLHESSGFPLIPYVKAGVDCGLWSISDTAKTSSVDGVTWGWHAAAGLALTLDVVDPDGTRTLDQETGVNQTALFFEVGRFALDGFGSSTVLRVGDTTWIAGLMLEM